MQRAKAEKKVKGAAPRQQSGSNRFYKIGEVCAMTDTQPYVLRFWESEFPQLAPRKSRSGQRLYEKRDVDLVLLIRKLLYDEEYTIAGARRKLEEMGMAAPGAASTPAARAEPRAEPPPARTSAVDLRRLRRELLAIRKILVP